MKKVYKIARTIVYKVDDNQYEVHTATKIHKGFTSIKNAILFANSCGLKDRRKSIIK